MKQTIKANFIMRHRFVLAVIASVAAFVFACAGLVVANAETAVPDDAHIVVLYKDGVEQTVLTRVDTVGALLDKLQIKLNNDDLVEPTKESVISADNFKIQIHTAQPTTVVDGEKTISLLSPYTDNREAVQKAGVVLASEDEVEVQYPGNISETKILGRKLVVKRAITVQVVLYGSPLTRKTQSKDVAGVLNELGVKSDSTDVVTPSRDTATKNGMSIFVTKQGSEVQSVEEEIAYSTETQEDPSANVGFKKVIQTGVNGKKAVFYEINKTTNQKTKIFEAIISAPVNEIIQKGTKAVFANYNADGIPERVFCGSPKQGNWKNINVENAAIGRALAEERGWKGSEFDALLELFACESSWNERSGNPYSGAYGIPQAWPATKMASFGDDYMTNPLTQLRWGLNYIAARYGTPSEALAFHYRKNYY